MSSEYFFTDEINLHVKDRIAQEYADRQTKTAKEILKRFKHQPGLVLADEVGMGKTFVALAVAISMALSDSRKRPIVVMVPPSLKEKWPRDLKIFLEKCLPPNLSNKINFGTSSKAVDFLKFLDDPLKKRRSIIFLTHGAMSRGLTDGWVKLGIIKRALHKRKNTRLLKKALSRILGDLLFLKWASTDEQVWLDLLDSHPSKWLKILHNYGIDPEHDNNFDNDDDPVPKAVLDALDKLPSVHFEELYQELCKIPKKASPNLSERIKKTRIVLNKNIKDVWNFVGNSLQMKLPLLILDEAHHLKNAKTKLASLFSTEDSQTDADEFAKGALKDVFERMLFLTATPFQLGHHELCSVLERFTGINWSGKRAPSITLEKYKAELEELRNKLDKTQESGLRFEHAWGKINTKNNASILSDVWWKEQLNKPKTDIGTPEIIRIFNDLKLNVQSAELLLKKYVIRHNNSKFLVGEYKDVKRREKHIGKSLIDSSNIGGINSGLEIHDDSVLPFLLASRAAVKNSSSRPVFAEGLASSYEAFLHTRKSNNPTDVDDGDISTNLEDNWYYQNVEDFIASETNNSLFITHPKVAATVNKAVELWKQGEKVIIFCHYIATGKCLRQYISNSLNNYIQEIAAEKFNCDVSDTEKKLDNFGQRFSSKDSQFMLAFDEEFNKMISDFPTLVESKNNVFNIIKSYTRTPSFLVRFFPLSNSLRFTSDTLDEAMNKKDLSGVTLRETIIEFLRFLNKCEKDERNRYMEALDHIQTGYILSSDPRKSFLSDDEIQGERTELLIPNVRLVNGNTKSKTRQNLMLTFNTPFYPDILITSSVLAEGVDLHLNCRHIIHHDLSWNPSTLEQRTGRIDRIGSKAERSGKSINVYIPYISETQDEKMYRVVTDREKWFKIVMGESYKVDTKSTDKLSERLPLPESIAEDLSFKLSID